MRSLDRRLTVDPTRLIRTESTGALGKPVDSATVTITTRLPGLSSLRWADPVACRHSTNRSYLVELRRNLANGQPLSVLLSRARGPEETRYRSIGRCKLHRSMILWCAVINGLDKIAGECSTSLIVSPASVTKLVARCSLRAGVAKLYTFYFFVMLFTR